MTSAAQRSTTLVNATRGARVAARITPSLRALLARLTATRVAFAVAVCALVSTQVLFQPLLYQSFSPGHLVDTWFEYLLECLLMGIPVMLGLTVAEALAARRPRVQAIPIAAAGLFAGAFAGALLLVPFYDLDWSSVLGNRFWVDVTFWMVIGGGIAATYAFQQRALAAADHLHAAQIEQAALARRMLEARLQVMRAQIEPHFLFNTLAHVKRLYDTDPASGARMLRNLMDYLAVALPQIRETRSTLAREVDHTLAYLNIQQVRMGRRLAFAVDLPPVLRDARMPPLMLLTLVENAIKHGLAPLPGGGRIDLRASSEGGRLHVQVADTGQGFAKSTGAGTGLANIRARLTAAFGHAGTLALALNSPHGVIATIVLPHEDAAATRGSA